MIEAPEAVEVEAVDDAAPVAEPTLRESLVESMKELADRDDAPTRDDAGRFKGKDGEVVADGDGTAPPADVPASAAAPDEPKPDPEPLEAIEPAPPSWGAEAKAKWADVPAEVRAEFSKRETEVRQMAGRMDNERQFGRAMSEVVKPYEAIIRANNTHPVELITRMMNTEYVMTTGTPEAKARMAAQALEAYGIDLDTVYQYRGAAPQAEAPTPPQAPVDINSEVERVLFQREVKAESDAFMNDPKNAHIDAVRPLMATLLEAGNASTLQEAYDMAVFATPTLRSTQMAAEKQTWEAQQAVALRTAQAKQAAVSLPGSTGSPRPTGTHETSLRDELRNGLREMTSAA